MTTGAVGALRSITSEAEAPIWEARYGDMARHCSFAYAEGGERGLHALLDFAAIAQTGSYQTNGDPFVAEAAMNPDGFCRPMWDSGEDWAIGRSSETARPRLPTIRCTCSCPEPRSAHRRIQ